MGTPRQESQWVWLLRIAGLAVAWEFYRLIQAEQTGDVPRMIVAAAIALFFWTLGLAVLIGFRLTITSAVRYTPPQQVLVSQHAVASAWGDCFTGSFTNVSLPARCRTP